MIVSDQDISYEHGIPESLRFSAAVLFDSAFGPKFSAAIPDEKNRIALMGDSFDLSHAFAAHADGRLVGLAGYATNTGSFTGGLTYSRLLKHLGFFRGNRAALVFSLYERKPVPRELLMDGIAVAQGMRGHGIGTELLARLSTFAEENEYESIRLDVVDTNPAARRLYERNQFIETQTERFEYLRWLLGFGSSTTLVRRIAEPQPTEPQSSVCGTRLRDASAD